MYIVTLFYQLFILTDCMFLTNITSFLLILKPEDNKCDDRIISG